MMGRIKSYYHEEICQQAQEFDDGEYFQLLNEAEWKAYLEEKEEEYHTKFGFGTTFLLKWSEFLNKNGE